MSTSSSVSIRIELPEDIFREYESQARTSEIPLEHFITDRLARYKHSRSEKSLTIEDSDRQQLEQMFSINISDSPRLVAEIRRALSISIDNLEITLPSRLIERLKSRSIRVPFEVFLHDLVIRSLEEHVGMR